MAITNLTGTKWIFNETLTSKFNDGANIDFIVNNENYTYIRCFQTNTFVLYYQKQDGTQNTIYSASWTDRAYRTIEITGGADIENTNFIAWLEQNAKQVKNLTNTTWIFKSYVSTTTGLGTYKINFTSNNENFVRLGLDYRGYTPISYYKADGTEVKAFDNSQWANKEYRTITITGGEDVESMNLLSFLNAAAAVQKLDFIETKTALKIYEDLSQAEYEGLEKEPNTFYLVNDVGVYKGEKLIATNTNTSNIETDITHLYDVKQDKLTAGENVSIVNNIINAEGGAPITTVEMLPEANEEELNKHKIYAKNGNLNYLTLETLSEPMNEGEIAIVSTLNTSYFIVATSNESNIYFINYQSLYKFNTITKEITTLYTLSSGNFSGAGLTFYNDKIYIFGGYGLAESKFGSSAVYTYDILTNEMTLQTNRLSTSNITNTECCIVGRYAYIVGGYKQIKTMGSSTPNNSYSKSILKYDLATFTCSSLGEKLPEGMAYCKPIAYGTDIYIFGGYGRTTTKALQTILKFDTLTNTLTTLETTLPVGLQKMGAVLYNDKIYIFGGSAYNYETSTNADSNVMYEFDPKTETIKTLETTIGAVRRSFGGALSGQSIYLVGGASMNDISKMTFGEVVVNKTLATKKDLEEKQNTLTAGTAIVINEKNIISVTQPVEWRALVQDNSGHTCLQYIALTNANVGDDVQISITHNTAGVYRTFGKITSVNSDSIKVSCFPFTMHLNPTSTNPYVVCGFTMRMSIPGITILDINGNSGSNLSGYTSDNLEIIVYKKAF